MRAGARVGAVPQADGMHRPVQAKDEGRVPQQAHAAVGGGALGVDDHRRGVALDALNDRVSHLGLVVADVDFVARDDVERADVFVVDHLRGRAVTGARARALAHPHAPRRVRPCNRRRTCGAGGGRVAAARTRALSASIKWSRPGSPVNVWLLTMNVCARSSRVGTRPVTLRSRTPAMAQMSEKSLVGCGRGGRVSVLPPRRPC